jgi:hypothetical protein
MKSTSTRSWAGKLVESFQNDACKSARDGVLDLTANEADLLAPPPRAVYEPWVVPLTFRPNDAAEETADDYAALSEKERAMISARTKAELAATKAQETVLGNPRLAEFGGRGAASNKGAAAQFAANLLTLILPMNAEGRSLRQIAAALNQRRIPTARGGKWAQTQVADILRRAG